MPIDHYEEAKRIAGLLAIEGFKAESDQIVDVIRKGRSGTEIFMRLRFLLAPLATDRKLSETTRIQIVRLHKVLNESLAK